MPRPAFDTLPLRQGDPPFSAWGLYGLDDELGTLNLLTEKTTQAAAAEIKTGERFGLNLPLDFCLPPSHKRRPLEHTVLRKDPRLVHDDELSFNTQVSTQWDGFRHYGYQRERIFYNGVQIPEISGPGQPDKAGMEAWYFGPSVTPRLGLQAWCTRGIVGRGVLLDYLRWTRKQGIEFDLLGDRPITVKELQACAADQGVEFREGDILILRNGWTVGYSALSSDEKVAFSQREPTNHVGVHTGIDMARWLWDTGFSACAGDSPGWERWPAWPGEGEVGGLGKLRLHEVMLNGWGMPIGEMLDLEALSAACEKQGRWTFFFSSMPLNVNGGVGSPCNAIAIL